MVSSFRVVNHDIGDRPRWYNQVSLGSKAVVPVVFALLVGGCPKRQTEPRVVYVQPPPAVAAPASAKAASSVPPQILTIEAPPPAPQPAAPPATASTSTTVPTQPVTRRPPRSRADSRAPEEEPPSPDTPPPADAAQAPPLEPAGSAVSEAEIASSQHSVQRRIDSLKSTYYSTPADRQILDDARAFVNQSEQALKEHNLLKAQELVEKSSLLLDALEPKP
jgi:hypothetical protein